MRVPAVVGSFPEPFLHGSRASASPSGSTARGTRTTSATRCRERLDRAGVAPAIAALGRPSGKDVLRVVVGEWEDVRARRRARQIEEGPGGERRVRASRAAGDGVRDRRCSTRRAASCGPSARAPGIVAATRFEEQQPTWVVTGTDAAGLERAVRAARRARAARPLRRRGHRRPAPIRFPRSAGARMSRSSRPTAHRLGAARGARRRRGGLHARALRGGARHSTTRWCSPRRSRASSRPGSPQVSGPELRRAARLAVPLALLVAASTRSSRARA